MLGGPVLNIYIRSSPFERARDPVDGLSMRVNKVVLSVLTLAAIAGCHNVAEPRFCNSSTTTAAYRDEISVTATVFSITSSGNSSAIVADESSGRIAFVVADTTAVFVRVGDGQPQASNACRLPVGEVVEIPLGDGFGDFNDPPPPPTVSQVVIRN